ncbi:MAG: AraC family ligand binding domain-containing protein, partial [Chitinophaga rupis]
MHIHNLFEPYEIDYKELNECPVGAHKNTFFELVYIVKGSGIHHVNENSFGYDKGSLFLLLPQHVHSFKVKEMTSFFFIRFNDIYLKAQKVKNHHSNLGDWIQKLEYILQSNYHMPGCILQNVNDKPLITALVESMIREYVNQQEFHREVVQQLVNTIITVVARN